MHVSSSIVFAGGDAMRASDAIVTAIGEDWMATEGILAWLEV